MLGYATPFKVTATILTNRIFVVDGKIPVQGIQLKAFSVLGKPCLTSFEIEVKVLSPKGHTI